MILVLYREDLMAAIEALPNESATALHFKHILNVMEKKELQAVAIMEHG